MKRTNIYLEEDQLRLLKHIAVEEGRSLTELVRQVLQEFLKQYQLATSSRRVRQKTGQVASTDEWNRRLEQLLARVRRRTRAFSPKEIEADITTASKESRRRRYHAARSR